MASEDVYCTLLMSDSYLPGAAVLAHSLRDAGTTKKLACLITPDSLLYNTITHLKTLFDYVIPVDKIANPNLENLARLDRLDLRFAFTKIALWRQEQFRKIVYIDSDVVAMRAPDELFDLAAPFAAAPDIGWPDCFNSGVMLLTPNMGDFVSLQTLASSGTSFDGADQGLLNEYFGNRPWHRLSFTYNCTPSSSYQYEPAFRHFRSSISVSHFIGKDKPWSAGREALSSSPSAVYRELLGHWWSTYDRHYSASHSSAPGALGSHQQHMKQFIKDEKSTDVLSWEAQKSASLNAPPAPLPEASITTTEQPMSAPDDQLEAMEHMDSHMESHRVFEPPQNPWDATRSAPPTQSVPEAQAFPSQHYAMSADTHLFKPPTSYPEPPRDMYYAVPPRPVTPEKPKPLFPWEKAPQRPSRVFPTAYDEAPTVTSTKQPSASAGPVKNPSSDQDQVQRQETPVFPPDTFDRFNRVNAWDNVASIETYVRAVRGSQNSRLKAQGLPQEESQPDLSDLSFELSKAKPRLKKPDSLVLTDFPTAIERPSLPVTPAPIGRPTFWGGERDEAGELPAAEGVPDQKDWNPTERLEQLRRESLITAAELPSLDDADKHVPQREVIGSSMPGARSPVSADQPTLGAQHSVLAASDVTESELGAGPGDAIEETPSGAGTDLIGGGLSLGGFGNTGFTDTGRSAAAETVSSSDLSSSGHT